MKAVIFENFGGPEVLKATDWPDPKPTGNQVGVRIKAASVNHLDFWIRRGSPAYPVDLPHILGADGAGIVEETGPEAEGVSEGDRVVIYPGFFCGECPLCRSGQENQCVSFEILGAKRPGTYAEKVLVPDMNVIQIPDSLSFEEAAALPVAYLTAWHMLVGRAKLQPNETVLVVGSSSGVGVAAVQMAKWKGAKVWATTTHPDKIETIKSLGADDVLLDAPESNIVEWIKKKTSGMGVQVAVDHVGPATWERSLKALAPCGRLVMCGATTGPTVQLDLRRVFGKDLAIFGARMGTQREFQDLLKIVSAGEIKPLIHKTFPLDSASAAHSYVEEKKHLGKVILLP